MSASSSSNSSTQSSIKVRSRFAPSPTGYLHIGNLRTTLFTYLIAKKNQGTFILRIEDTDQARLVEDAVQVIYDSLKTTGLNWDEGPDVGGPFGPYIQSERKAIYAQYAEQLVQAGHAYRCFCSKETLDEIRKQAETENSAIASYDGRCSRLSADEIQKNLKENKECVIRQKISKEGSTTYHDVVYGDITISNDQLDDQVLMKADGLPTYNFANVIDDHLMEITHVVRGVEYLNSTPKYVLLYKHFGWEVPVNIHLPHILGPSGKKLSKRDGAASLSDFINKGYIPEAIVNYVALLGWSPGDNREFFTLKELEECFDISRINKASAIFDEKKLRFLNSQHLKSKSPEEFYKIAEKYFPETIKNKFDTQKIAHLIQNRVEALVDIPEMISFLNEMPYPYDKALFEHAKMKTTVANSLEVLKEFHSILSSNADLNKNWNHELIQQLMLNYATEKTLKNGQVMWPMRVALTGLASSPGGASEVAEILGREETLKRIQKSMELL